MRIICSKCWFLTIIFCLVACSTEPTGKVTGRSNQVFTNAEVTVDSGDPQNEMCNPGNPESSVEENGENLSPIEEEAEHISNSTPGSPALCLTEGTPILAENPGYQKDCGLCHGAEGMGSQAVPGVFLEEEEKIRKIVRTGKGGMPAFTKAMLNESSLKSILASIFLDSQIGQDSNRTESEPTKLPYCDNGKKSGVSVSEVTSNSPILEKTTALEEKELKKL